MEEQIDVNLKLTSTQQMISSCTGAVITSLMVTPLDVVKIRIQAQEKEFLKNKCFLYCNGLMDHICYCTLNGNGNGNGNGPFSANSVKSSFFNSMSNRWYKRPTRFHGTFDGMIQIARNEGITSLWSGLPPTLVMAVPATVIYFTVYEQIKEKIRTAFKLTDNPLWLPSLSGACARIFAAVTISPLEMIRTKMQSEKMSYLQIGRAVKSLVEQEGYFALYRGLVPTILRDVPFSAIYWCNYEFFRMKLSNQKSNFYVNFASGAIAGTIAAVITLPFDVVKTHRQIELGQHLLKDHKSLPNEGQFFSTFRIIKGIYSKRGISGLFAGLSPRVIKVAPACAIMISTYESGKSFFRHYNVTQANNNKR